MSCSVGRRLSRLIRHCIRQQELRKTFTQANPVTSLMIELQRFLTSALVLNRSRRTAGTLIALPQSTDIGRRV